MKHFNIKQVWKYKNISYIHQQNELRLASQLFLNLFQHLLEFPCKLLFTCQTHLCLQRILSKNEIQPIIPAHRRHFLSRRLFCHHFDCTVYSHYCWPSFNYREKKLQAVLVFFQRFLYVIQSRRGSFCTRAFEDVQNTRFAIFLNGTVISLSKVVRFL